MAHWYQNEKALRACKAPPMSACVFVCLPVCMHTWQLAVWFVRLGLGYTYHIFTISDRVQFKLGVLMYRCLHGMAPLYLMDSCTPTADVAGRQHLRYASQRKLIVPHYRLNSYGRHSSVFCCCRPVDLEFAARQSSQSSTESQHFSASAEETLFCEILTRCTERIRDFLRMRYINLHFTYLL